MGSGWFPLWLSLRVAGAATLLVLMAGIPLAWMLARRNFPGKELLGAMASLPLVLPPTVLGYYLLVLLGNQSPLGRWLNEQGFPLVFTWRGAVIAAAAASFPLLLETTRAGFESVDVRLENVARTLSRSDFYIFWRVTLPLAWRSILAGTALSWRLWAAQHPDGSGQHPRAHANHVDLHLRPGTGQPAGRGQPRMVLVITLAAWYCS